LYGLWAGRSISARRLKGIAPLLKPGTSVLVAWDESPLDRDTIATLRPTPDAELLVTRWLVAEAERDTDGGSLTTVAEHAGPLSVGGSTVGGHRSPACMRGDP
jgi:hypothetical protein